jgi:hypothetical protein
MIENCTDFTNYSRYTYYEWASVNNRPEIVNCYDIRTSFPHQLIPVQYQGWFLLAFLIFGTVAICYGLCIVARDPMDKYQKKSPTCYYYMTEDEIKETFN